MDDDNELVGAPEQAPQAERFIHLVEEGPGKFRIDSNISGWEQSIKALAVTIRNAEVKQALGMGTR
jgi:hypothetical protein